MNIAKKKEITVLYSFPHVLGRRGGIGWTAWNQISETNSDKIRHIACCYTSEYPGSEFIEIRELMSFRGLTIPRKALGRKISFAYHDWYVSRIVKRFGRKLDLIHCWPSASLKTLQVAKESGIPTLMERPSAHTRYIFNVVKDECERIGYTLPKFHWDRYNNDKLKREEAEFASADWLLCPSKFVVNTFLQNGIAKEKLITHQYGYDPLKFCVKDSEDKKHISKPIRFVFVGECGPRKGLHLAIDAWFESKIFKNCEFLIYGNFTPGFRNILKDKLNHPSIKYFGYSPDIPSVFEDCDVLVLPSLAEGSALVVYEAQACGCVPLVSNSSGAYCEHLVDSLVHKTGDKTMLARHLFQIANDHALRRQLREKSILRSKKFTWECAGKVLSEIYMKCLGSN